MLLREVALRRGLHPVADLIVARLEIRGRLNITALKRAIEKVVERHAALHTIIVRNPHIPREEWERRIEDFARTGIVTGGLFQQILAADLESRLALHDISQLDPAARALEVQQQFESECSTPMAEDQPLSLRSRLIRLEDETHLLTLTMDHRVSDGWSANILSKEIPKLYHHFADGDPVPPLPGSYLDFVSKEGSYAMLPQDLKYWHRHWSEFGGDRLGFKCLPFFQVQSSSTDSTDLKTAGIEIEGERLQRLRLGLRRLRVTTYVLFLASILTVLKNYTKRSRIAVWTYCANRNPGTAEAIGYFLNKHLMGFDLSRDVTAHELLGVVDGRRCQTVKHQRMPLAYLWTVLQSTPRFPDSGFVVDYVAEEEPDIRPRHRVEGVEFKSMTLDGSLGGRAATIGVYLKQHSHKLLVRSHYFTRLYRHEGIKEFLEDIVSVAEAFVDNPEVRLSHCFEVSNRYPSHNISCHEMAEFIIRGSQRIPPLPVEE